MDQGKFFSLSVQGSLHLVNTGWDDSADCKIWETFKKLHLYECFFPHYHMFLPTFHKTIVLNNDLKKYRPVWNKILNINPCKGQLSGTWQLIIREYCRKSLIFGTKHINFQRLTVQLKPHLDLVSPTLNHSVTSNLE